MRERQRAVPTQGRAGANRVLVFALLCGLCVVAGVGHLVVQARAARSVQGAAAAHASTEEVVGMLNGGSVVVFRSLIPGPDYGAVALVKTNAPADERVLTDLHCDRLDYQAGRGICLASHTAPSYAPPTSTAFDDHLRPVGSFPTAELPSRARVAPDGVHGATTGFNAGDSYLSSGFSTRTMLLDLRSGAVLGNLEDFAVERDGQTIRASDFNFWGVTYARDGDTFYATLKTGGVTYLVRGTLAGRRVVVLRKDVECPSLSPDGKHIAFKSRDEDDQGWHLRVLDTTTLADWPLGEQEPVDDQAQWLDDQTVLYGTAAFVPGKNTLAFDVRAAPVDGGPSRLFIPSASSPAVVRLPQP